MATVDTKKDFELARSQLRTLRDEIRVHLHLGTMDLKDAWKKLEPRLDEAERMAGEVSEATRKATRDLVKRATELRDALHRLREQHQLSAR